MAATLGAVLLAVTVAVACWRIGRNRPLLLALQPLWAMALWLALWPLPTHRPAATLVLATANTPPASWAKRHADGPTIALPEAPPLPGAQPTPDLATALRRLPDVGRLHVLGDGLRARDREALGDRGLSFEPAPPRPGVVELLAPTRTVVGQPWTVRGRLAALPGARVDLIDPGGRAVAQTRPDATGTFRLVATPPALGRVDYMLRVRDAAGREHERAALALDIVAGRRPRLWLLSGGPDPEQKFLRRWADDNGLSVRAGASLGGGVHVGDPMRIDAAALGEADLLVLDARAWRGLGAGGRAQLRRAVADGMGLLLRLQDAPTAADRALLHEFGFDLSTATPAPVRLAGARAPFAHEEVTTLGRAPAQAEAADAVVLWRDESGAPLARWRALGRGRVAIGWLGESYRLVLSGQAPLYGRLWSQAMATVARADAAAAPRLQDAPTWAQERAVVCDVATGARVRDPAGRTTLLLPDARGCAAWWPAQPGWHRVESGDRVLDTPVLAQTDWPGVRAQADRDATRALQSPGVQNGRGDVAVPGPRWPGFVAWLLLGALGWWLERRRTGVAEPAPAAD